MMLYIAHRAIFMEVKCRHAQINDREAIQELLITIPIKDYILDDFDLTMDPLQHDAECFVFKCNSTIFGFAILWLLHIPTQFSLLWTLEFSSLSVSKSIVFVIAPRNESISSEVAITWKITCPCRVSAKMDTDT